MLPQSVLQLLEKEIDLVFPVLHGPYGEDGKIQGFLDTLNIKYVGCDLTSSAVGMDKAVMKQIFSYYDIPQSKFNILKKSEYNNREVSVLFNDFAESLGLPFFIKPANMGSSIGISRVRELSEFEYALKEAFK
jgi:D-alanine-D-alanine ligase